MRNLIIGFVLGVIGSLVGAIFAHTLSERRDRRKEFNEAAAKFRDAFIEDIRKVKNLLIYDFECDTNVRDILVRELDWHHEAKIRFEMHLGRFEKIAFNKVWCEYEKKPNTDDAKMKLYYLYSEDHDQEFACRRLAISHIEKLLTFSKLK